MEIVDILDDDGTLEITFDDGSISHVAINPQGHTGRLVQKWLYASPSNTISPKPYAPDIVAARTKRIGELKLEAQQKLQALFFDTSLSQTKLNAFRTGLQGKINGLQTALNKIGNVEAIINHKPKWPKDPK